MTAFHGNPQTDPRPQRSIDLEQALAIPGREGVTMRRPTGAHPDCTCGKPKPPLPDPPDIDWTGAPWGDRARRKWVGAIPEVQAWRAKVYALTHCPQHDPLPRRTP